MVSENIFFLHAVLMGVFITFIYDNLRILRRVIPHKDFFVSLEDLCFWIYCGAEVFVLLNRMSDGKLRWFAVLGAMVGMFSYKKLFGWFYVKYMTIVFLKLFGWLYKVLFFLGSPFRKVLETFRKIFGRISNKCKRNAMRGRMRAKGILKKKLTFLVKILKMTL